MGYSIAVWFAYGLPKDLISKQSEIVSRTLPQCQAELSAEIQKIATDLAKLRETTGSRDQDLEATAPQCSMLAQS